MLKIQEEVDLTLFNTLHLESAASHFVVFNHVDQLEQICSLTKNFPHFFILGGGSNIVIPRKYQGLVIHNQLKGIEIISKGPDKFVTAMAGENWDDFVAFCTKNKAFGLENLSLIPGTVGASPIQNIGAYGVEVKDFIEQVLVYDLGKARLISLSNKDCDFSYRKSFLKNNPGYLVVSVTFKLSSDPKLNLNYTELAEKIAEIPNPTPEDVRKTIIEIRQNKLPDPQILGNAGSFFHNPIIPQKNVQKLAIKYPNLPQYPTPDPDYIKISAGWLIDNLGLKGARHGNLGVYSKQALVLVNYGGACQESLLEFAGWIQSQVQAHYDVQLNIEPIIL